MFAFKLVTPPSPEIIRIIAPLITGVRHERMLVKGDINEPKSEV